MADLVKSRFFVEAVGAVAGFPGEEGRSAKGEVRSENGAGAVGLVSVTFLHNAAGVGDRRHVPVGVL
jgi:hypothetical protein